MNKKFVILSDSCCELNEEMRKKYDVDYIPMYISYMGENGLNKEIANLLGE